MSKHWAKLDLNVFPFVCSPKRLCLAILYYEYIVAPEKVSAKNVLEKERKVSQEQTDAYVSRVVPIFLEHLTHHIGFHT